MGCAACGWCWNRGWLGYEKAVEIGGWEAGRGLEACEGYAGLEGVGLGSRAVRVFHSVWVVGAQWKGCWGGCPCGFLGMCLVVAMGSLRS